MATPEPVTLTIQVCVCGHANAGHMNLTGRCLLHSPDYTARKVNPWRAPIRKCECEKYTQKDYTSDLRLPALNTRQQKDEDSDG